MPLLTIVNLTTSELVFQDPTGNSSLSFVVRASATLTDKVVTSAELSAIEPSLILEATASKITWTTKDNPASVSDSPSAAGARLFRFTPAAKGTTDIHALYSSTVLSTAVGFTNPVSPRNLRVVKSTSWNGGTVTITGTDQFDAAITEVFPALGAGTEVGVKIFKTVTGLAHSVALAGGVGVSVGTGDKIGLPAKVSNTIGVLWAGTTPEVVTVDTTYHAFTPTTTPDGTVVFTTLVNCLA